MKCTMFKSKEKLKKPEPGLAVFKWDVAEMKRVYKNLNTLK